MKVLIAPDSFKESLPAADAAAAIAEGVLAVCPSAVVDLCPMADGGEGTVAAMVAATGGQFLAADVFDPLGGPIRGRFAMLGRDSDALLPGQVGLSAAQTASAGDARQEPGIGGTAVIEMAAASGLALVRPELRDPTRTTTFGTGQLILAALDEGATEIIIGIGGSATNDGGCGCAQALGVEFIDRDGNPCVNGISGGALAEIASIDISGIDPRIANTKITVACDVKNPLTGLNGAAAIYGPQKGATEEMVQQLDANLSHLAEIIRRDLGLDVENLAGSGAAGGLGGGLVAFAGAKLENGGQVISNALSLSRRLAGADLCITGEGKLDSQVLAGKALSAVADLAGAAGVPVVCIPGQVTDDAPLKLFAQVLPLVTGEITARHAMTHTQQLLAQRAAEAVKKFLGCD